MGWRWLRWHKPWTETQVSEVSSRKTQHQDTHSSAVCFVSFRSHIWGAAQHHAGLEFSGASLRVRGGMDQRSCDAIRHEVPMGQTEQEQRATQQRRSPQVRRWVRKEGGQRGQMLTGPEGNVYFLIWPTDGIHHVRDTHPVFMTTIWRGGQFVWWVRFRQVRAESDDPSIRAAEGLNAEWV